MTAPRAPLGLLEQALLLAVTLGEWAGAFLVWLLTPWIGQQRLTLALARLHERLKPRARRPRNAAAALRGFARRVSPRRLLRRVCSRTVAAVRAQPRPAPAAAAPAAHAPFPATACAPTPP